MVFKKCSRLPQMLLKRSLRLCVLITLLATTVNHNLTSAANVPTRSDAIIIETENVKEKATTETATEPLDNWKDIRLLRRACNWLIHSISSTEIETLTNGTFGDIICTFATSEVDDFDSRTSAENALKSVTEGRTFGKIRRLQMALIPIMFKFGVLSAMVAFLVLLGIKSLILLKILVLMNTVAIVGRFFTLKPDVWLSSGHHAVPYVWNPHVHQGWRSTLSDIPEDSPQNKEIHLHLHGLTASPYGVNEHNYPYVSSSAWNRRSNDPFSSDMFKSYTSNFPLEVQNARPVLDDLNKVESIKNSLPQNHRNI